MEKASSEATRRHAVTSIPNRILLLSHYYYYLLGYLVTYSLLTYLLLTYLFTYSLLTYYLLTYLRTDLFTYLFTHSLTHFDLVALQPRYLNSSSTHGHRSQSQPRHARQSAASVQYPTPYDYTRWSRGQANPWKTNGLWRMTATL